MATAADDLYRLLSISPSATPDQVRRAYKRACLRHHPDKHPPGPDRDAAEAIFKSISLAYSQHSSFSHPNKENKNCNQGTNFSRADFEFSSEVTERHETLQLTLAEFYNGCVKRTRLSNAAKAPLLTIAIKHGYRPGDRIRFRNIPQDIGPPLDVVFTLSQKPHSIFTQSGDDLNVKMRIRLVDALAGAALLLTTPDNKQVSVCIDTVIHPDYVHRVPNKGMPKRSCPTERGDLLISFDIAFPPRVEAHHRSAIRDVFARLDAHMTMKRSSSLWRGRRASSMSMPWSSSLETTSEDVERKSRLLKLAAIFR